MRKITGLCLLAGLLGPGAPAVGLAGCLSCHDTNGCQTPAKPGGTCADCHLGPADVDDFESNFIAAVIDRSQWQEKGHGQAAIAMTCDYCHTYDIGHGDPANPFRLANTATADAEGQNRVCLACHQALATGYDPDGDGAAFTSITSVLTIEANHAGARHTESGDGGRFCWDCHDPHGDDNLSMIQAEVSRTSDGLFGIPAEVAPVSFADNLTGSDYVKTAPPYDGVCQVCHTRTNHWLGDGTRTGHNVQTNCLLCHEHNERFRPNCNSCHGFPPLIDTARAQDGLVVTPAPTGAASAGAHGLHAGPEGYGYSCYTCHFAGMPDTPIFDDYQLQMGFDVLGFSGDGSIYNTGDVSTPYAYEGTNGTVIGTSGVPAGCGNIYCHSDGTAVATSFADPRTFPGPDQSSPPWDGQTACDSCHSYPPSYAPDDPKANKHDRHMALFTNTLINPDPHPCHFCHYTTTTDGRTISSRAHHVNRQYDVNPDPDAVYFVNELSSVPVSFTYSYDPGGGSCADISCHQAAGLSDNLPWGFSNITAGYSASAGSACGEITFLITVTSSNAVPPYIYSIDWESDGVWDYVGVDNSHTHVYPDSSPQIVTYSVRDAKGHTLAGGSRETGTIYPSTANAPPVVAVTAAVSGYTVTLTDQSLDPDYNSCGHIGPGRIIVDWGPGGYVTYDTDLSDSPSGARFNYTYTSPGTYTIRYGVYDNVITYPEFHPNISVTVPRD